MIIYYYYHCFIIKVVGKVQLPRTVNTASRGKEGCLFFS